MDSNTIDHQAMSKYGWTYCGLGLKSFTAADKITHLVVHRTVKFAALTDQNDADVLDQYGITVATEIDPFFIIHAAPGTYFKNVNISLGDVHAHPERK